MKDFFYHLTRFTTLLAVNLFVMYPFFTYLGANLTMFSVGWWGITILGIGLLYPIDRFWYPIFYKYR